MTEEEFEKISLPSLGDFYLDYFSGKKFPNLRFGQAFLDKVYPEIKDETLFYEEDTEKALLRIHEIYVDVTLAFGQGKIYDGRSVFFLKKGIGDSSIE